MKNCILFLHGTYPEKHIAGYRKLCRGKCTIAIDGGYSFFKKAALSPDLIIGDFDSIEKFPSSLTGRTEMLRYPPAKDKTDAELALEYCFEHKVRKIDIVQPIIGEPDQFMGNLMLLTLARRLNDKYQPEVRIINTGYEILFLENKSKVISGAKGDIVSIIPLSPRIKLSCRGTAFPAENMPLRRGQCRGLRNRISASRAVFDITGQAFLVHQYAVNFTKKHA
ncbi:MAG: thiamine diphosphokinase [candidate division Zixibacteria bacterium]|nr:thiamine diphosphokinase [candidate division Zixibacteria bacterium]